MKRATMAPGTITIGLDLGDRYSHFCLVDASGTVQQQGRVTTTPDALRRHFTQYDRARLVVETGTHSPWVSRLLEACGHEVIVANPRKVRLIYASDSKNDRVDAECLARVARLDPQLLAPIRHRGASAQADLALLRARDCVVRARTQLVNHVRGAVKATGGRLPRCSTDSFARKVVEHIPAELEPALMPMLQSITQLSDRLSTYDAQINELARTRYPETTRLRQVTGIGALTALCYILTLEDPDRFPTSRTVGAYLGLRPRQRDSGQHSPQLRITKRGDAMVRRLLVGAAHYILGPFGPDCDFRRWGTQLAARGGKNAKKRAVVAVARKLAVVLHHLWRTGEVYQPLRRASRLPALAEPR